MVAGDPAGLARVLAEAYLVTVRRATGLRAGLDPAFITVAALHLLHTRETQ
jgi:hypothetical protein